MSRIFGIDLGTTNSLIAVMEKGVPRVLADPSSGRALLASVVALGRDGVLAVGDRAIALEAAADGHVVVRSVKRFMGLGGSDLSADDRKQYDFVATDDPVVRLKVGDRTYTPPQISAEI